MFLRRSVGRNVLALRVTIRPKFLTVQYFFFQNLWPVLTRFLRIKITMFMFFCILHLCTLAVWCQLQLDWTPSRRTRKISLPASRKGYIRLIQDYVRTKSSRQGEVRSTWSSFVWFILTSVFQNYFRNNVWTSLDQAESDSPRQIFSSEVPRLVGKLIF